MPADPTLEMEPRRKRRGFVPSETIIDGNIYEVTLKLRVEVNADDLRGKPWRRGTTKTERIANVALDELNRLWWLEPASFYRLTEVTDAQPASQARRSDPGSLGSDLRAQER